MFFLNKELWHFSVFTCREHRQKIVVNVNTHFRRGVNFIAAAMFNSSVCVCVCVCVCVRAR
jgi:hypothetical protein